MSMNKNSDEQIDSKDIMVAVPSMVIAVGILTLPNIIAQSTRFSDGWIVIVLTGIIAVFFTWVIAKLASKFPSQSFLTYSSSLVSRPVAIVLTLLFSLQGVVITAYEIRMITDISHEYLFEKTPIEVIALSFLLIVIYAISGSRIGVFRLNILFLPIILVITAGLIFFSISYMKIDHLLPVFTTDIKGYIQGSIDAMLAYIGFSILFFYVALTKDPKKVPKRAAIGMSSVIVFYLALYLTSIAVFGVSVTEVLRLPIIELAKSVEIPGGFFERMESLFFVIWVTAIFTTTMMAFDVAVLALQSIFSKVNKRNIVFSLSPFILFLSMIPDNYLEMQNIGDFFSYYSYGLAIFVALLLWVMYGIRGGKQHGK